jgi:seipin
MIRYIILNSSIILNLHFDYTDAHPTAVFSFNGGVDVSGGYIKKKHIRVPVGHAFSVSLSLLMPESDFNRELGVFQVCLFCF